MEEENQRTGPGTPNPGPHETDPHIAEEKVRELLEQFRTAMLVTRTEQGALRARPMIIAEAIETGVITFITSSESGKVDEIGTDAHVAITLQGGTVQAGPFMSITGTAQLDRRQEEIDRLYGKIDDVWFEGPQDPHIVLIRVHVNRAEYWDQRGLKGVRYVWEAVKAVARGGRPHLDESQHGVLNH